MSLNRAFSELNNAILDLQQADYNTFDRPLKKIAKALNSDELKATSEGLSSAVDFDAFLEQSHQGSGMAGSASLNWPDEKEQELGLTIALIERGAESPDWFMSFARRWFYSGSKHIAGIQKLTKNVIIPFGRDFKSYVEQQAPAVTVKQETHSADMTRVFIVHGHDDGARQTVARLVEQQGLTAVILDEQASKGMTVPEKLIEHGNVGFAVVLITPDDVGRSKHETTDKPRPRQNVILELGYFVGRLGRSRVCALLKDDVEMPSDYIGTVYVKWDDAGAWKFVLAKELAAAGYQIDLNKI